MDETIPSVNHPGASTPAAANVALSRRMRIPPGMSMADVTGPPSAAAEAVLVSTAGGSAWSIAQSSNRLPSMPTFAPISSSRVARRASAASSHDAMQRGPLGVSAMMVQLAGSAWA